jgi:hypothetical protein
LLYVTIVEGDLKYRFALPAGVSRLVFLQKLFP